MAAFPFSAEMFNPRGDLVTGWVWYHWFFWILWTL